LNPKMMKMLMTTKSDRPFFSLRRPLEIEIPQLSRLQVELWQEAYESQIDLDFLKALKPTGFENGWRNNLQNKDQLRLCAEFEGEMVGFCGAGPARDKGMGAKGEMYAIYLRKKLQGRRLGKRMMVEMFQFLLDSSFDSAYVWVLESNPTCDFYKACGGELLPVRKSIHIAGKEYPECSFLFPQLQHLCK